MTYSKAVSKAVSRSRETGREYFVVREWGEYHIADSFDLDTFFIGIPERDILFCTSEY